MHGVFKVTVVRDLDCQLRALAHSQRRAGNRAVVGEHPHGRVAELLRHRRDPQVELIRVGQLNRLWRACLLEALVSDGK